MILLGGPIFVKADDPEEWALAVRKEGYSAAYCPLKPEADDKTVRAYAEAADRHGVVIAETGAWSNPLSSDEKERAAAMAKCTAMLDLAERIGARCCVNITGSRSEGHWDGPDTKNLTDETFDKIVQTTRSILDAVRPTRTFYTLETMPWMFPESVESYQRLIQAIDRPSAAVHFDAVNLVNCPRRHYDTTGLIRHFVDTLGPLIKSCHAKDIRIDTKLTLHLDEVCPGEGGLDYPALLRALDALPGDVPLMLEHLPDEPTYRRAANHVRRVAQQEGIKL
ncbi:MAG: TIM barrel protein [Phycisphaerae bacterium]